ncbi:glucose-6-phosphate dehydrogenase [Buchnera aphidicola]|uniref:glucose-6-phosphate dehydrogenase n=1 Tax=Buchnera aphidicola TaxID=9 RepID=UPI0034649A76
MNIENNNSCDIVIFGTKGDLAKRKLLPALYKLEKNKKIHQDTRIIGVGRAEWTKEEYSILVKESIKKFINEEIDKTVWKHMHARLYFCNINVNDICSFEKLKTVLKKKNNIIVYYCATPPHTFYPICKGLGSICLNTPPARIIIEKPLGTCLKTSKKINNQISKYFSESQIFRIDHYLGKEAILNLIALRFSNSFFFHNWNNKIIDHIQITVAEQVGIENRWNYFDNMGQMRDMVQNHLLQILTLLTISPPKDLTCENIQNEKIKILRALRPIHSKDIDVKTVRGQYISGYINNCPVPSYQQEKGANNNTETETFVAIRADIDNETWSGVPFYLRTGKRLPYKYSEVVISFKKMAFNLFSDADINLLPNQLIMRLEPEFNIKINFFNKKPGFNSEYHLNNSQLEWHACDKKNYSFSIDAYERLLLESMKGIQSLFVSRHEIEYAWNWIDPIVFSWKKNNNNHLQFYSAGTWGPEKSKYIINRDHRNWHMFDY